MNNPLEQFKQLLEKIDRCTHEEDSFVKQNLQIKAEGYAESKQEELKYVTNQYVLVSNEFDLASKSNKDMAKAIWMWRTQIKLRKEKLEALMELAKEQGHIK